MSEVNEEKDRKKSSSKIGALLSNSQEANNSQISVYYSQNDWKTSEIVEVMVDEKTTVLQLIDSVIFKLKTEFYYDDIDEKNYNLMILKKKTKTPNYDYPKCNPESLVLDYYKSNFCLVEQDTIENVNNTNEEEEKNNNDNKILNNKEKNKKEEKKDLQNNENNEEKEEENNNKNKNKKNRKSNEKECKKGCILY